MAPRSKGRRHSNPLGLATPVTYCGGPSFATIHGIVAHITLKEENNLPLPNSRNEIMELYKFAPGLGQKDRLVALLQQKNPQQKSVPVFWEPVKQLNLTTGVRERIGSGKLVVYVGHWEFTSIEVRNFRYLEIDRCAIIRLRMDRFDKNFAGIIGAACDKTFNEMEQLNLTALTSACGAATKKRKVSPEKLSPSPRKQSSSIRRVQQLSEPTGYSEKQNTVPQRRTSSRIRDKEAQASLKDPTMGRKQNLPAIPVPFYRRLNQGNAEGGSTELGSLPVVFADRPTKKHSIQRKAPPQVASVSPEVIDLTQSDDDNETNQNAFSVGFWAPTRKPNRRPARKSIPKKQPKAPPAAPAQREATSPLSSTTAAASITAASNNELSSEGNESKPAAKTFFRIIVQGAEDEIGQSVRVPSRAEGITFQTIRKAIEKQLVPHRFEPNLNWHFFVPTLGRIYPSQEGWEVLSEVDKKKKTSKGSALNPYEIAISIS